MAVNERAQRRAGADNQTPARIKRLAWLLDNSIRLPGGYRIGLDGIIGLVPGLGDVLAAALSCYIVVSAVRLGTPASVVVRMLGNVLLELVLGAVPVLGDLFDFAWKANARNARLVEAHLSEPQRTRYRSRWLVGGVAAALLVALAFFFAMAVVLGSVLWRTVSA